MNQFKDGLICLFLFLVSQNGVCANCPVLSGNYICQSGEFSDRFLDIKQTELSDLGAIGYQMSEYSSDTMSPVGINGTFTAHLDGSLNDFQGTMCFEENLIVSHSNRGDESFSESSVYSFDPVNGALVRSVWQNDSLVQKWICTPFEQLKLPIQKIAYGEFMPWKKNDSTPQPHVCTECGKGFKRANELKDHKNKHTGVFPFHCKECGSGFNRAGHLKDHQSKHTGAKPYICNQCKSQFSQSANLRRHLFKCSGSKSY